MLPKILIVLYKVKQKKLKIFEWKKSKITKWSRAFKGYASTYGVKILNYFNSELEPKESTKKEKGIIKQYITRLMLTQKQKQLLLKVILIIYFSQFILWLYDCIRHKKISRKGSGWITDSVIVHNIDISICNFLVGTSYIKLNWLELYQTK